jgi:predicted MFS family arabinose efflux permease
VLLTLAGVQFTHILDFMIMMPLGPQFTQLLGISNAQFGLLVSAYTLSAGASGLMAAMYVDQFDRKRLLLTMYTLFGLATLSCGLAPTYGWLMLARVAAGVFGGVLSALSQTIVADVVPFERRGRAMGVVMTSFSVSTVAGVPLGLFLAAHWSWHVPFFAIAILVLLLIVVARQTLPVIDAHLHHPHRTSAWRSLGRVLADANHLKAFALSGLMMFAGFTVIPYITIYMQSNAGMHPEQIPWIYLAGGAATLVSARYFGHLTDRLGKAQTFRRLAAVVCVPLLMITMAAGLPVWGLMLISTSMFMAMSGRMIPGMALISSASVPHVRGTFMTLNASVQSAGMGLAAIAGGLIIGRDAQGHLTHYGMAGLLGALVSLSTIWVAGKVHMHEAGHRPVTSQS